MQLNKYPHPANFAFAEGFDPGAGTLVADGTPRRAVLRSFEDGVRMLRIVDPGTWAETPHMAGLEPPKPSSKALLCADERFDLVVRDDQGREALRTVPGAGFGVCGEASVFQFEVPEGARFYGMGEKLFGRLELSGVRTRFWNTDVWSDFHWAQWHGHPSDPPYCSVPYVACDLGHAWVGILAHNPGPVFIETPGRDDSRVFVEWQRTSRHLVVGSSCGEPCLWIVVAPSLAELTRRFQRLVGTTPLPPLWSLGFHQSRWGYGGEADLVELDRKFEAAGIPCSGLWLDLDYMDGFRIFTVDGGQFPHGVEPVAEKLGAHGRRIVAILDPGVKREPGYRVFDDGLAQGVFCQNPVGRPFVGLVWPGETVFPDFTTPEARSWWAEHVAALRRKGFGAFWVDMNDPSTGPVEPEGMLFRGGTERHELHRNQYALGMQMATFEGLLQAAPDERPFVLSRSGCAGTAKYAAVWTGDNVSNEFYLQNSLPTSLGMSISGLPFNGPDIGGFGGDAGDELMVRWFQAGFLFPFFRNHTTADSRREEPWEYPAPVRRAVARSIRLRYRLLPYLYDLYAHHETDGDALLRPVLYDFPGEEAADLYDQFLVGPWVLQAPVLELGSTSRKVWLPGGGRWLCGRTGLWRAPGRHTVRTSLATTPLWLLEGAVVPMLDSEPRHNDVPLAQAVAFCAAGPGWKGATSFDHVADDGISYDYRNGGRSRLRIEAEGDGRRLLVRATQTEDGFGPMRKEVWLPRSADAEVVGMEKAAEATLRLTGRPLPVDVYREKS